MSTPIPQFGTNTVKAEFTIDQNAGGMFRPVISAVGRIQKEEEEAGEAGPPTESNSAKSKRKLGERVAAMRAELVSKDEECARLREELAVANKTVVSKTTLAESLKDTIRRHNTIYEDSLKERNLRIKSLAGELSLRDSAIQTLTLSLSSREAGIQSLTSDISHRDSKIQTLTLDISQRDSRIQSLTHDLSTRDSRIQFLTQDLSTRDFNTTQFTNDMAELQDQNYELEAEKEELLAKNRKLLDDVATHEQNYKWAEGKFTEKENELKEVQKKLDDTESRFITAREELRVAQQQYVHCDTELYQATTNIKNLKVEIDHSRSLQNELKKEIKMKEDRLKHAETLKVAAEKLNVDMLNSLNKSNDEIEKLKSEISKAQLEVVGFVECQELLEAERIVTQSIKSQMAKMRNDKETRFPLDPQAFQPKAIDGQKPEIEQDKSLFDELDSQFGNSMEKKSNASQPPVAQLDTVSESGESEQSETDGNASEKSNDSMPNYSSSGGEEETDSDGATRYITNQVPIYLKSPYEVTSHNPVICWFTVEYIVLALFMSWICAGYAILSPMTRRAVGLQVSGKNIRSEHTLGDDYINSGVNEPQQEFNSDLLSSPHNSADEEVAGMSEQAEELRKDGATLPTLQETPENREVITNGSQIIAPRVLNSAGTTSGLHSITATNPSTVDPNLPFRGIKFPAWKNSLINFGLHLVFYYFLYHCYLTYCERELWISANELTRSFLYDVLLHRRNTKYGRGLAPYVLPESWASEYHKSTLSFFQLFGFQLKTFPVPG